jgi:hypothetical protein
MRSARRCRVLDMAKRENPFVVAQCSRRHDAGGLTSYILQKSLALPLEAGHRIVNITRLSGSHFAIRRSTVCC